MKINTEFLFLEAVVILSFSSSLSSVMLLLGSDDRLSPQLFGFGYHYQIIGVLQLQSTYSLSEQDKEAEQ